MEKKIKSAVLRGLTASAFSAVVMYLGLRAWIVMTISIGPVDKLYALVDTATAITAGTAILTTTIASYTTGEKTILWK